jgi:polar amino acid transport system substrate-binding protein
VSLFHPSSLAAFRATLAPHGTLRVAINLGNAVLAQRRADGALPCGVSVELAHALGARLGVPVALVQFDAAGQVMEALGDDGWDIAFLAVDPLRSKEIAFSPPYVLIEGRYMVRDNSPVRCVADVDRPGMRVAVGEGSVYDLHLSRTLKHAQLLRFPTAVAAFARVEDNGLEAAEVAAGIGQVVEQYARQRQGLRVVGESFMAIAQAIGVPAQRAAAAPLLWEFIEELKASGFVADALRRSGQDDVTVAPPVPRQQQVLTN